MADYPSSLYTKTTVTDNVTSVLAAHHNDQEDEILAVETELGTDVAGSKTDLKTRLAVSLADDGTLEFADSTVLTISSGAITVTQNFHRVATEGGAGSDYLVTINGLANDGAILFIRPSTSNDIILDHDAGNISCPSGADITLADTNEVAMLVYDANLTKWVVYALLAASAVTTSSGAANSYIAIYTAAGNIEGTDDLQWDGTTFTLGDGTADRDYEFVFNGETNQCYITYFEDENYLRPEAPIHVYSAEAMSLDLGDGTDGVDFYIRFNGNGAQGILYWMEDEDYFKFADDILMTDQEAIYFDSTDTYIKANADDPEDLQIGADQDILLEPDNLVINAGGLAGTPDAITATSDGVAASLTTMCTEVTTNGDQDLDNVTLANGVSGQIKHIYCVVQTDGSDTWKITPATMCGGSIITFSGAGEGCTLVYADNEGWVVIGNNGGTIS